MTERTRSTAALSLGIVTAALLSLPVSVVAAPRTPRATVAPHPATALAWTPSPVAGDQPAPPLKSAEPKSIDDPRKARIKAIDTQIQSLRAELKAQVEPLEAQIKELRGKTDSQIDALQAERKTLLEQGESTELLTLNEDEARQLASLSEREKSEIAAVHQRFKAERTKIEQDFQARRHALAGGKK